MKKLFLKITFFFISLFFGTSVFATHIMGGEITWECQNNGQYVFTLKVYRDCNGISYSTNNLALEAHNYPNAGDRTLIPVSFFSVIDITPSCEGSPCATLSVSDPDIAGAIEEYVLKSAPITLNGVPPANGWAFTWTSGNRNAAIDNINNASNYGITLRAIMFPYFGQNANLCFDSSPDFYQKPSTIICAGERFTYNHSAFDNNLDSLSYEWAKPLEGNLCGTSPCRIGGVFVKGINPPEIPFKAADGYSFDSPYPGVTQNALNEAAVLDPETGEITFTSFTEGEYVSVIKVTAYKCGEKVAEIFRELQTVIASGCSSNEPPIISKLANNSFRDTVKVGDTVRFRISILDSIRADNPNVDSIFVFASGQQFGTNFTNPNAGCLNPPCAILTSPLPDTGIGRYTTDFYWETTCDHIQNTTPICFATANSYQFIIRAFDNFCPAAGQTIATYTITILADSLVENPPINCANVFTNGDVTIDWDGIHDPDESFSAFMIYVADFRNGPYTLLDSIFDSTVTSYTHIGAGANNNGKHYIVKVRSGCQAGWTILPSDTISTFYINPILNDTCISINWTGLNTPISSSSDTNYLIFKEYPIGSGFVLYDSTNQLSYCDTFNVCADTVTYRIQLGSNSGDCPFSTSNTQGIRFKYPDPVADFTFTTPCSDLTIPFTNATTVVPDSIAIFAWNFGDGDSSALKNPSHTYTSPGSYTVQLITTTTKGCVDTVSKTVTPDVPFVEAGPDQIICLKDSIQIGGSPTSSTLNVTYSWTPISGLSNPSIANPNASPSDTTIYTVLVTNTNGCTNVDTMTVFVKPLPVIDAGAEQTICIGDTVAIGGSPTSTTIGVAYTWQPAVGLSSTSIANPKAFPVSTQTYKLTVTSTNGCFDTSEVTVNVNDLPIVDAGTNKNICVGQTVTIGGTPTGPLNATYSWTPATNISNATVANPDVSPIVNTTYFVEVTDTNGCISIVSVAIILQPTPEANAGIDQIICKEDFPTLLNGSVSISNDGRWIGGNGVFDPSRNVLNPTYDATPAEINAGFVDLQLISSSIGICTPDTDEVRITIPAFVGAITLNTFNVSCNGLADGKAAVNTTGANSPYSYSWNTNTGIQTGDTARGLIAGTYSITITNSIGCDSISSVTITQPAVLVATIVDSSQVSCFGGNDGTARTIATGGTAPYTYLWPSNNTDSNEVNLSAGTYVVTVTDNKGCIDSASVTITEPTLLVATIVDSSQVSCFGGNDGTARTIATGGTAPYTYQWPSTNTDSNEVNLSAGTYTVTITDNKGCIDSASVTITEPTLLVSTIVDSSQVSCFGGNDGTARTIATGGTAPYTYLWPSTNTDSNEVNLSAGTYVVTITDNKGCIDSASVTITESSLLVATIVDSSQVSCFGGNDGTARAIATGGTAPYTYLWTSTNTDSNEVNLSAGTYAVTITDNKGCVDIASVTITEPTLLVATIVDSSQVSCFGGNDGTATAMATGGTAPYTYLWPSTNTDSNEVNLSVGTYVVTITDNKGCIDSASVTITEPTLLVATIVDSSLVSCFGGNDGTARTIATGGTAPYSYLWPSTNTDSNEVNLAAGTYVVTITDNKGCVDSASVNITEPTLLVATIVDSSQVSCFGGNDGTARTIATGGTAPYTYLWPSTNTDSNEVNLAAGIYVVTVTDNKGCLDTASVTITEPTLLVATIVDSSQVSCFGGNDGTASAIATGGTAPYTYLWPSSNTDSNEVNLSAGTYAVTITDNKGCVDIASITITEPTLLIATIVDSSQVSCFGGNDGTARTIATGGTAPYTYQWPSSNTDSLEENLSAGTYVVTVTDNNGCIDSASITITEPTLLVATIVDSSQVSCFGGNDGTARTIATGGTAPYTYQWPSSNTDSNEVNLSAGTYVVTVTDSKGCADIASVTITEPTLLVASISNSTNVSCFGGNDGTARTIATGGTAPYTYQWPSTNTDSSEVNLSAGTYTVTITDNKGCIDTASVTITQPTLLVASILNFTNVSCFGGNDGTATGIGTGGTAPYTYRWPSTNTDSNEVNLAAGRYVVTITDNKGCIDSASVTITEPTILVATIVDSSMVSCFGGNDGTARTIATGGTPPYTYLWPSTNTDSNEVNLAAGTYVVTITDNKGCIDSASITITEPTLLVATIVDSSQVSCFGGNDGTARTIATGGTAPYTYLWPSTNTDSNEVNLSAGTYVVTVTDTKGCVDTASVTISQPTLLAASISNSTNVSCFGGNDGTARTTATGGTAPYTYLWPSTNTDSNEVNLSAGRYVVTITDSKGCIDTVSVTITQPDTIQLNAAITNVSCFGGNDGAISITATGGQLPYTYLWTGGITTSNATNLQVGSYTVTLTDFNGCQLDSTFSISQPTEFKLNLSVSDTICIGDTIQLLASGSGGNPSYTFSWSGGLGLGASKRVSPPQNTTYLVTATDSKGCIDLDSVTVSIRDLSNDDLNLISGGDICEGEESTVLANHQGDFPTYTYLWKGLGSGLGPFTVRPQVSKFYTFSVTDLCGVVKTDSILIQVNPNPKLNSTVRIESGCAPLTITVNDTLNIPNRDYTYEVSFGDGSSLKRTMPVTHTYANAGNYSVNVKIINDKGCESVSSGGVQVNVHPNPIANFTASRFVTKLEFPKINFSNTSFGANSIRWTFFNSLFTSINDTMITYQDTGRYVVKLIARNSFGCIDSISKEVIVEPTFDLKIPTGFTPNSNGSNGGYYDKNQLNNDVFFVYAEYVKEFKMNIFNRWGELIFVSNDVNIGWDGYYHNRLLQQDVYVYMVEITWIDGTKTKKVGDITLLR